jgi:DNA-binding transcriptional LysR family regulator
MLDRVTGLQVFARVAALGSLSAAAREIGMSQTMATKHMAAIEARLGTKLVHRTTRRLTLTEAGRGYLEAVERILAEIEEADAAASVDVVDVRGTLRLNVPVSFGMRHVVPLLPELARRHPHLTIDLGLNDRQVDLIEEGWDLVVRIGALRQQTLVARRLAPCRMVVCAAPRYLARHGTPEGIVDLRGHNCLSYTLARASSGGRWAFGVDGAAKVAVSGTFKANNGDALTVAAVAGLGIVYAPTFLVSDALRSGALVTIELDHAPVDLEGVFAAYPFDRRPAAKVRACIELLAERFAPVPPWEVGCLTR